MRLGAAFIAFSGLELLKPAILSIRPFVDFVTIIYSEVSHLGFPAAPYLKSLLKDLSRQGLVDALHSYEANPPATSPQEVVEHMRRKRELARRVCQSAGCTHIMVRDCDEFYSPKLMRLALWIANRYDITFSYVVDYTASPLYQSRHLRTHDRSPFIQRVEFPFCPFNFGVRVDPARTVTGTQSCFFFPAWLLLMHHMTRVRLNDEELQRKYENHSWYPRTHDILRLTAETRQPDLRKYRILANDRFGILDYWNSEFRTYATTGLDEGPILRG